MTKHPIDQAVSLTFQHPSGWQRTVPVTSVFESLGLFIPEVLAEYKVTSDEVPITFAYNLYRSLLSEEARTEKGDRAQRWSVAEMEDEGFTSATIRYDNLIRLYTAIREERVRDEEARKAEKVAPVVDALEPFGFRTLEGEQHPTLDIYRRYRTFVAHQPWDKDEHIVVLDIVQALHEDYDIHENGEPLLSLQMSKEEAAVLIATLVQALVTSPEED